MVEVSCPMWASLSDECLSGGDSKHGAEIEYSRSGLMGLLEDEERRGHFHLFLKNEFAEENLEFWNACNEYMYHTPLGNLSARAEAIVEDFICRGALKQVNIDYHTREQILGSYKTGSREIFAKSQNLVFEIMFLDSFQRFCSEKNCNDKAHGEDCTRKTILGNDSTKRRRSVSQSKKGRKFFSRINPSIRKSLSGELESEGSSIKEADKESKEAIVSSKGHRKGRSSTNLFSKLFVGS
eukprot:Nk52_evm1s2504 gene=Nk52_evmTU1s2504